MGRKTRWKKIKRAIIRQTPLTIKETPVPRDQHVAETD
jgi:hypothetical protein